MKVVHSDAHRAHDPPHEVIDGEVVDCFESPARADRIRDALLADDLFESVAPDAHGLGPIEAVHDPAYVAWLAGAWERWTAARPSTRAAVADTFASEAIRAGLGPGRPPASAVGSVGWYGFDTATPIVAGTYPAARAAVDIALTATDAVLAGDNAAYGLCRPPGHHAPYSGFGGYCFLNNAAIAADHAVRTGGSRVAILDVDYHHGSGTQQIFYDRGDVLFVSLHADPDRAYPYFTGHADETGTGSGLGMTVNLPLPANCDDESWLAVLDHALDDIEQFAPAVVVVSLGFDTFELDPISDFALTAAAYGPAGAAVGALGQPTVVLQEGGYHVPALGELAHAWLRAFAGVT
jgi:acetoin utilization deacetylase AcuC-like enzyme